MRCSPSLRRILNSQEFISDWKTWLNRTLLPGRINSLAQTLMKRTAREFPTRTKAAKSGTSSLVDPDNRGPVDYEYRQSLLAELDGWNACRRNREAIGQRPAKALGNLQSAASAARKSRSGLRRTPRMRHWQWKAQRVNTLIAYLRGEYVVQSRRDGT